MTSGKGNTTKYDLAVSGAAKSSLSLADAKLAIDVFLHEIRAEYRKGNRVELRGFGTFFPHFRKGRRYRNPATGEVRVLVDTHVLKFKSSTQLYQEA
jgi:integration host factor subunit beta